LNIIYLLNVYALLMLMLISKDKDIKKKIT